MKFRMWLALVACTAAAASGLSGSNAGFAQDVLFEAPAPPPEPPRGGRTMEPLENNGPWDRRVDMNRPNLMHEIEAAAAKVRDADSDGTKAEARKELTTLLDKYFEEDMKRRADELAKIEERVKKLHALLEKRAAKKQEIIDLQIKVLENEADGLGFFNDALPPGGSNRPMMLRPYRAGYGRYGEEGMWIGTPPDGTPPRTRAGGTTATSSAASGAAPPLQPTRAAVPWPAGPQKRRGLRMGWRNDHEICGILPLLARPASPADAGRVC